MKLGSTTYYHPLTGWTIDTAISRAIDIAKKLNTTLNADINDTVLAIDPQSDAVVVKNIYLKLLNEKYQTRK